MAKRKTKAKPTAAAPQESFPRSFEMFIDMTSTVLRDAHYHDHPHAFNGMVRIRRYRVTIDRIEEPVEVLRARLKALWRSNERNHHRWDSMRRIGYELGMTDEDLPLNEQGIDHPKDNSRT